MRRLRARPRVGHLARRIVWSRRLVKGLEDIQRGFDDIDRAWAACFGHMAEQQAVRTTAADVADEAAELFDLLKGAKVSP